MEEFGKALQLIFAKIADFFDIFDLSFLVSGIASATALATFANLADILPIQNFLESTLGIFVAALTCYTLGLVSFASGRWIRITLWPYIRYRNSDYHVEHSNELFEETLTAHGLLNIKPFKDYLSKSLEAKKGVRRLYVLFWAEIRQFDRTSSSLQLLKSYWVKAATYDGVAISMLLWACVAACSTFGWAMEKQLDSKILGGIIVAILLLFFAACLREAKRYHEYQVEELVASFVSARRPILNLKTKQKEK